MAEDTGIEAGLSEKISNHITEKADKIKYIVLAVLALVVIGVIAVTSMRRADAQREKEGEDRLFQALVDLETTPETDGVAVFAGIAKDYRGLPTGARALIAQFAYSYNTKDYAGAEKVARDFVAAYPRHALVNRMRLALAQSILMQENRTREAIDLLADLTSREQPDVFPEAKLAYAQALEMDAEAAKNDPEEYRRRLQVAADQYNDIIVRSEIAAPLQRGFWPQAVLLPAQYSLAVIKDKLLGHQHQQPQGVDAPLSTAEREAVMAIPPPADTLAGPAGEGESTTEEKPGTTAESDSKEETPEAAGDAATEPATGEQPAATE